MDVNCHILSFKTGETQQTGRATKKIPLLQHHQQLASAGQRCMCMYCIMVSALPCRVPRGGFVRVHEGAVPAKSL